MDDAFKRPRSERHSESKKNGGNQEREETFESERIRKPGEKFERRTQREYFFSAEPVGPRSGGQFQSGTHHSWKDAEEHRFADAQSGLFGEVEKPNGRRGSKGRRYQKPERDVDFRILSGGEARGGSKEHGVK